MKPAGPIVVTFAALFVLGAVHCASEVSMRTAEEQLQVRPMPKPEPPIEPRPEPQPRPRPTHTGDPPDAPPGK